MSSRFDHISIGEVSFTGPDLSFFGEVRVYYNTPDDWLLKDFTGIFTDHGDKYRGQWDEDTRDFDRLSAAFMADSRLVEVATECIKRRLDFGSWKTRA